MKRQWALRDLFTSDIQSEEKLTNESWYLRAESATDKPDIMFTVRLPQVMSIILSGLQVIDIIVSICG